MTPRQERFVQEYLIDLNATQAAIRAGYAASTANREGSRLLSNVDVQAAIQAGQKKASEKAELSQQWVLDRLRENAERALQAVAVLDRDGNPTGEYQYEGAVANRSLELLGKHLGMFTDKLKVETDVRPVVEVLVRTREEAARLLAMGEADGGS